MSDDLSPYAEFENPSKLAQILNEISKKIFALNNNLEPFELSNEAKFELELMDYDDKVADILNKYCK